MIKRSDHEPRRGRLHRLDFVLLVLREAGPEHQYGVEGYDDRYYDVLIDGVVVCPDPGSQDGEGPVTPASGQYPSQRLHVVQSHGHLLYSLSSGCPSSVYRGVRKLS